MPDDDRTASGEGPEAEITPHVSAVTYYPVKGCRGVPAERARVTPTGLEHDRSFMIVDPDGVLISQRRAPHMALIEPKLSADGAVLTMSAPGRPPAEVMTRREGPRREVSMFGRWSGTGVDQGDEIGAWCGAVLDMPCRLVRLPPEHHRATPGLTPGTVGFADGHALLVCSQSSLDDLNARIQASGGVPVAMERFRPNVIVSGWPQPYIEDHVRRITLGTAEIGYAKPCARCKVPTIDQATGRPTGAEPLRTLARYRHLSGQGVCFGIKAAVTQTGEVKRGVPVAVHVWHRPTATV